MKANLNQNYKPITTQKGLSLFVTLILMVVLLIASVALIRSVNSLAWIAGNIAFKQDSLNRTELGMTQAISMLSNPDTGTGLSGQTDANAFSKGYSATIMNSDKRGIPLTLLSTSDFDGSSFSGGSTLPKVTLSDGTVIRFVTERLCSVVGPASSISCILGGLGSQPDGKDGTKHTGGSGGIIYRITSRYDGPRGTVSFAQMTVSL
jgi:type IV pilus assembly protein PilX